MSNEKTEVDAYIASFSGETRRRLEQLRELIQEYSPDVVEALSYGLVGYKRNGKPLVYFGGFEKHIGFMRRRMGMKLLLTILQNTNRAKALSSCHLISHYQSS